MSLHWHSEFDLLWDTNKYEYLVFGTLKRKTIRICKYRFDKIVSITVREILLGRHIFLFFLVSIP
jgi:hypothetical protein